MNIKTILAAGVLAVSLPFAASAATVSGDFSDVGTNVIGGTGVVGSSNIADLDTGPMSVSFDFEVNPARSVEGIGTVRRSTTVENLVITFNGVVVATDGGSPTAEFHFGPANFQPGEIFTLTFSWTAAAATDNIDFDVELAPVPVPAAGLLLASVMGGGAFVARRRKKKADA
ncbi:VPLPA-CTERM sorting domain-containing protein [uncultured Roseobacter sp.]|uniref:VPLPA-CTERM sorting domain-containing protein n=1 Tax=uncultured Roseobacter sp. TaxID=114847 RepID=UPI00261DC6CE|nr:VPLPA-CTERM sorting domain-containing protein [uncultured Roseobacter sp.]